MVKTMSNWSEEMKKPKYNHPLYVTGIEKFKKPLRKRKKKPILLTSQEITQLNDLLYDQPVESDTGYKDEDSE